MQASDARHSQAAAQTVPQSRTRGSDSSKPNRTSKDRSPKLTGRKAPRNTLSQKKQPLGKVSELESQIAQLAEELNKAKDQVSSSESLKNLARQEADKAKKELASVTQKLDESQKQFQQLSDSEEVRIQELLKISHERDRAWQSELEVFHKQHSMDSTALASAMNEIQKLKMQLEKASQVAVDESANDEIQNLGFQLSENLTSIDKLKTELSDCKESESRALEKALRTQMHLEMVRKNEEELHSKGQRAKDAYDSLVLKLEQSNARENSLKELVSQLQSELRNSKVPQGKIENDEVSQLNSELSRLKLEAEQLRSALDAAERKYQEEYIQSTLQIRCAYELVERTKLKSKEREAELEDKLEVAKADIQALKVKLEEKRLKLQNMSEENKGLDMKVEQMHTDKATQLELELERMEACLEESRTSLLNKETELGKIMEENELLKSKINVEALASVDAGREKEDYIKCNDSMEEADTIREAAMVIEQLDAAKAVNSGLEAELRKLKVQSEQWRKAAEAAAAMIPTVNNERHMEKAGYHDYDTIIGKLDSPLLEVIDDYSPKKKNGKMLKKIGVLLKGHK